MSIKVVAAGYGTTTLGVDVTAAVQARLDQGNDEVVVTPEAFGIEDPAPNVQKYFGIVYTLPDDPETKARAGVDFDRIELVD